MKYKQIVFDFENYHKNNQIEVERRIEKLVTSGLKSRERALYLLHKLHRTNMDGDLLCLELGLPEGYFSSTEETAEFKRLKSKRPPEWN